MCVLMCITCFYWNIYHRKTQPDAANANLFKLKPEPSAAITKFVNHLVDET